MNLLIAIAMLCGTHQDQNIRYKKKREDQLQCQKQYVRCVIKKRKSGNNVDLMLEGCVLERTIK